MFGRSLLRLLVLATVLASPNFVRAQEPPNFEALKAAEELMAVMSGGMIDQIADETLNGAWPQMMRAFPLKIDAATEDALHAEMKIFLRTAVKDAMKDAPAIYARHLTATELRAITAFYSSPAGKASLRVMPAAMKDIMTTMIPRMQASQAGMAERFQAVLRERGYVK